MIEGVLDVLDPRVTALVDPGAELERLLTGFVFTEGPVWDFRAGHLTFTDIPGDTIHRWDPSGGLRTVRRPSNFANGLTYDRSGCLIACEHVGRRVSRETADGVEVVASSYAGKRLNSPNDVVVAGDGSVIFTDPNYGLSEPMGVTAEQEQPAQAVYRVAPGATEPEPLATDFAQPNGLVLTADERVLLVDDTVHCHIRRFAVGSGWTISGGEVFAELPRDGQGSVDGMKLDVEGNLYCTGPGGVWVLSPAGELLGRIRTPEIAANIAWGDDDARMLYITATTGVYRVRTLVPGLVPYRQDR